MKTRKFYPNDGRPAKAVSSTEEIRKYMGEIMEYGIDNIDIIDDYLVVSHMNGLPITLGILK